MWTKVTGDWKGVHYEEFHNVYSLPNINGMIKSCGMAWAGHAVRKREKRKGSKFQDAT
jgi:hypothetical protein